MPRCIDCSRFMLSPKAFKEREKEAKRMAGLGFGRCAAGPSWEFHAPRFEHECAKRAAAEPATVQARELWLKTIDHNLAADIAALTKDRHHEPAI